MKKQNNSVTRYLKQIFYKIKYQKKLKKYNFDDNFLKLLISCFDWKDCIQVLNIIDKSKNKDQFQDNVIKLYSENAINKFIPDLLLGNVLGKYYHFVNGYEGEFLINVNSEFFKSDKLDLMPILKQRFYDYIMNDNKIKNFILGDNLNSDISIERLNELFNATLDGKKIDGYEKVIKYLYQIIGNYTRDDILNKFDFILYDINHKQDGSLDERRKKYEVYSKLSNEQIMLIDNFELLKKRLNTIKNDEANNLLNQLESIKSDLILSIDILQNIYLEYEVLLRNDLLDRLYCPTSSFTLIEDYKDVKPQLIHRFVRSTKKIEESSKEKIKNKIISERKNGDKSVQLSNEEMERYNSMLNALEAGLDQYRTNYFVNTNSSHSDADGYRSYYSDTANQISASIYNLNNFLTCRTIDIWGVGFNRYGIVPESIALTSPSYLTTNMGINNLEYETKDEFRKMSAPYSELSESGPKSEIVMFRRGIDFDTKASYIFATIDSSNPNSDEIISQIKELMKQEKLGAVVYDLYKIKKSYENDFINQSSFDLSIKTR